jgi:phthalate 4,5-dioxygenase oxygenase subunit
VKKFGTTLLTQKENERLYRVGPGTPMGMTLRRYWQPFALSTELAERDGPPIRVRILGEDLVAFRDSAGGVGLLSAFCPHRRAPMFFGRNEEQGLRCVYHGWKFDRTGACVDMPSEPPDSLFKTKVTIESYPTWEAAGFVWTYMGPAEHLPAVPDYELLRAPAKQRWVSKSLQDSNYLQALEGGVDTSHTHFLHKRHDGDLSYMQNYEATVPRIDVHERDYGYIYTGIRLVEGRQWVRGIHFLMPNVQMRADIESLRTGFADQAPKIDGHIWVPIDDVTTCMYTFMYAADPARPVPEHQAQRMEAIAGRGPGDVRPDFRLKKSMANDFHIDRGVQKTQTFTGIEGINTQDLAVQEGMGPIVDRSKEHLGSTDRAVIVLRRLLLEAVDALEAGRSPRGVDPAAARNVRPVDHFIPAEAAWEAALQRQLTASY